MENNKNQNKILIIDIETSNLSRFKGKILEIGMVSLNIINGEREIVFDSVIREDGITKEEIESSWIHQNSKPCLSVPAIQYARPLSNLKKIIQNIINDYPLGITAFNNTFDFHWIENRGFHLPRKLDCPMIISKPIVNAISDKTGKQKRPNVEEAYEFFTGEKLIEAHRGADDAWHEALIVWHLIKLNKFNI